MTISIEPNGIDFGHRMRNRSVGAKLFEVRSLPAQQKRGLDNHWSNDADVTPCDAKLIHRRGALRNRDRLPLSRGLPHGDEDHILVPRAARTMPVHPVRAHVWKASALRRSGSPQSPARSRAPRYRRNSAPRAGAFPSVSTLPSMIPIPTRSHYARRRETVPETGRHMRRTAEVCDKNWRRSGRPIPAASSRPPSLPLPPPSPGPRSRPISRRSRPAAPDVCPRPSRPS